MANESTGHVVRMASGRSVRMPIDGDQFTSLVRYLDEMIAMQGCDNTLHHAEAWARAHKVGWGRLARSLRGMGGFCDCEVGMNVALGDAREEEEW